MHCILRQESMRPNVTSFDMTHTYIFHTWHIIFLLRMPVVGEVSLGFAALPAAYEIEYT